MNYQQTQQNTYPSFEYGASSAAMLRSGNNMRNNDPSQPGPARYKEYERKREGFRRYLEQYGVLDLITNVLTNMHDNVDWTSQQAPNGLDVFRQLLLKGSDGYMPEEREVALMQQEISDLKHVNKRMAEELHKSTMQQQPQHSRHYMQSNNMGPLDAQFDQMAVVTGGSGESGSSGNISNNMPAQPTSLNNGTPMHANNKHQQAKLTPPEMSRSHMSRC